MPFNRVHDVKAMLYWLLILNKKDDEQDRKGDPFSMKLVSYPTVPQYIPGLMLIPIPEAGFWLGHVDIGFWAAFLYVFGSALYFIDSFFLWWIVYPDHSDDALNPGIWLNTAASLVFVLNAIACILDWWVQFKQMGAMNLIVDEANTGGLMLSEIPQNISAYYFYNNFFFMGAAVVYMIQAIWMEDPSTDLLDCQDKFCGIFWMNFWGSMLYLGSSYFSVLEFWEYRKLRIEQGLPVMKFFTCTNRELDWFGWGDVLFLATSLVAVFQCFISEWVDDGNDTYNALYLLENVLFLVDSLAYFVGYILYMLELRNSMVTGMIDAQQTGSFSALLENIDVDDNTDTYVAPFDFLSNTHWIGGGTAAERSISKDSQDRRNSTASRSSRNSRNSKEPHRLSFTINEDGKVSMDEIRQKLSEARAARMLRKEELRRSFAEVNNPLAGIQEESSRHNSSSSSRNSQEK